MTPRPARRVVIVGCGRLGSHLADRLSRAGCEVIAVDADPAAFDRLAPDFSGFRVTGDATEIALLRQAGVQGADALIAATRDDCVNLMVTQTARKLLGVRFAAARVFEPTRAPAYADLGIETVCPTTLAAEALLARMAPRREEE